MFIPIRLLWFLVVMAVLLPVGVFLLLRSSTPEPILIQLPAPAATPAEVRVYVSGAVQTPGVYQLAQGDRVENALRAAGGAMAEADLEMEDFDLRDHAEFLEKLRHGRLVGRRANPLVHLPTRAAKLLRALKR